MSYKKQELLTLTREHLGLPRFYCGIRVWDYPGFIVGSVSGITPVLLWDLCLGLSRFYCGIRVWDYPGFIVGSVSGIIPVLLWDPCGSYFQFSVLCCVICFRPVSYVSDVANVYGLSIRN